MKRNKFSLSHSRLASFDGGELVPIGLMEVLPGDSIQHATSMLLRASPLLSPVMHPVHVRIHHWYVPHRLVWEDFEKFITGGPDGMDASVFPTRDIGVGQGVGSLCDYLGLPVPFGGTTTVSDVPFRGYAMIWNEWYRDQDLQTELTVRKDSGPGNDTNLALQHVAWEKDYFTSARPWEQKGPAISVPLGDTAPVVQDGVLTIRGVTNQTTRNLVMDSSTNQMKYTGTVLGGVENTEYVGGLKTDLSAAGAANVNLLREAFALQRFEEARARYGSRYTEYLRYLGVRSSDARLQRPEYLGGGKQTVQFSEVLQTAEGTNPVGELRGHGIGAMRSNRYRRFIEEHGYIFSLVSVKPRTMYLQGLERTWNRRVKEDFWQMELQHIGQQEVLNKELYAAHASPEDVFGYQDRYDEYRRMNSGVSGEFRSVLNFWHMARDFASDPTLNGDFVKCVPTERTFAVPSEDVYYAMAHHSIQARRLVAPLGKSYIF